MVTVVRAHQILVNVPLQTVFDYVSDLTRHPEWSGGRLKIEAVTPGPVAIGTEYLSHGDVAGQKARPNLVQITRYESPHRFGFVATDPDFGKVSHQFSFIEQNGEVLIIRTMTLSLNPIVAFFFRLFIYPLVGSPSMDKSLAALKTKLEKNVE